MRKPLSLLSALLLTACVATPPTTPQVTEVKPDKLGLEGAPAPRKSVIFGISQSGRVIQTMLLRGLHADESGKPGTPRAFLTTPGQGINIAINTWHGVLTPLVEPSDFFIVDRGGDGNNLEEFRFEAPYTVVAP